MIYKVATRKSILAKVQADSVIYDFKEKCNKEAKKVLITTEGDRRLDVALNKIGGKGLFIKEVERALYRREAHFAVHSMKDIPYDISDVFEIAAIPKREDVRDVLVSREGLKLDLIKLGGKIGTSSIRRGEQLKILRPDIDIVPIRGNVQTRLKKMEEEGLDGIILAAAGIKRLGMQSIITEYFDPLKFIPAIGQGALAIEILRENEEAKVIKELDDSNERLKVQAERSFMKALKGGCHSLIGAYTILERDELYMIGTFKVLNKIVTKDIIGNKLDNIKLGQKLAKKILRD